MLTGINYANTLHDYDKYQETLDDYAYANYKTGTSSPGYEAKQKELKQLFIRTQKADEKQTSEQK